jgi:hypothetical protein
LRVIESLLRRVFLHSDITHRGDLYLRRFFIGPKVRGWQLMLHKICRPDADRVPHDHPWGFISICLRGGYVESVLQHDNTTNPETLVAGQVRLRAAEHTHRIDRILGDAAWTLVLAGPTRRKWGFWVETPDGGRRFVESEVYFRDGYCRKSAPVRAGAGT